MQSRATDSVSTFDTAASQPQGAKSFARFSAVEFLIALVLMILTAPLVEDIPHGDFVEAGILTLCFGSAVAAVADRRSTLIVAAVLALTAVVARWLHYSRPDLVPPAVHLGAGLALTVFVLVNYLRFILGAKTVDTRVLCAAISAYLMLGFLWTTAYVLLADIRPGSFYMNAEPGASRAMTPFNASYFSFVTLTTVGYGDIVPISRPARMLAAMEATTGTLFIAVLISRLVAIHSTEASAAAFQARKKD